MIVLTNPDAQVVQPGQAVLFTQIAEKEACCPGISPSGASVKLSKGTQHRIDFNANVNGAAGTQANLSVALGGEAIPWTRMTATIEAATDVYNVGIGFPLKQCCCDFDRVSVINSGSTAVNVGAYPMLAIDKR